MIRWGCMVFFMSTDIGAPGFSPHPNSNLGSALLENDDKAQDELTFWRNYHFDGLQGQKSKRLGVTGGPLLAKDGLQFHSS